jgi:hypothetical protein
MPILSRLTKGVNIPRKSLKRYVLYAVGEVALIFAGITLSTWFSNWNEAQQERAIEINILRELREGLVNDAEDVEFNIRIREDARAACAKILSFMERPPKYHDSLDVYFATAFQLTGTLIKTSAYENLKSRGLYIITNRSLRAKIIDLYDLRYKHIHESEGHHEDLFFNFLIPFNSERFHSTDPWRAMKPINYGDLMTDKEYKYYVGVLIFYNDFILDESKAVLKEIESLTRSIDQEVRRLE